MLGDRMQETLWPYTSIYPAFEVATVTRCSAFAGCREGTVIPVSRCLWSVSALSVPPLLELTSYFGTYIGPT